MNQIKPPKGVNPKLGLIKNVKCSQCSHAELKQRLTTTIDGLDSDTLTRVRVEMDYQLDVCRVNKTTPGVTTQDLTRSLAETTLFSAVYNNYKSFVSPVSISRLSVNTSSSVSEREENLRFEQLRLDEQKRKDEFELEKLRIQTQSKLGADTFKESDTKFLVKEVSKFIHRFDLKEDISLYLKLFERQAQRLNIDQENWVSHLLGLLPTEVSHIIAREPDDKANSYEHVKDLLLKRFKITPEKFRQLFVAHQKAPERTWIDFYHELNTYFNGWIEGLKIHTFKKLSDLIITDQLKRKTPFEFKEYYLDEWANMNSPVQLAEKLEEFEDFKRTLKQKSSSPFVKKQEYKFTEKNRRYEAPGKFEYNRKDKKFPASTNYNKHYEAPVTTLVRICSKISIVDSEFRKVKITALIDSGSIVLSLLRENTSRRITDPTKLSKNKMLLTGIGEAQVTTIGSFEHTFKIDEENYSLTWHVVPTDKLKFEAVIGSDLLEQASISVTKEGVKFNKYENHAQLMQISKQKGTFLLKIFKEELDLHHVENRQIKKEP
ncbi:homeotic protein female sterile [Trichonephila clavipes]|nr:homeotic protein female sterile [Trichonephila clavipes]